MYEQSNYPEHFSDTYRTLVRQTYPNSVQKVSEKCLAEQLPRELFGHFLNTVWTLFAHLLEVMTDVKAGWLVMEMKRVLQFVKHLVSQVN